MVSFAPLGPVVYCRTSKPYSSVRMRILWIPPRTSPTGFARSLNPPHLLSSLRCPITQPEYCSVLRSSPAKWPPCGHHKPANAHTPETTATAPSHLSGNLRHLLVPKANRRRSPKMHANVLPPARNLHQQALTAANVCTSRSGSLFVTHRITKKQHILWTLGPTCVFSHVSPSRDAGNAWITPCGQPMEPPFPHIDGPP